MKQPLNYEDNIFILNMKIHGIADILRLDADPDLFLERTLDDIDFIGEKLCILQESLTRNNQLVSKKELTDGLYDTYKRLLDLLNDMLGGTGSFSVRRYPFLEETLQGRVSFYTERRELLAARETEAEAPREIVGAGEMAALLDDL
jgi:hypothetical protein